MKKEYKINIDPRILELLGPNLYTNIYYVLAELIANAYDADATDVYIISDKDAIRVEDNGNGMSYEDKEIEKYLNVAGISRIDTETSFSSVFHRRKMGRKGIGKLAALSVSANVDVMTITESGEKSGFILSRTPKKNNTLEEIPDDKINFLYTKNKGTAIVMKNPQYKLSDNVDVIKHNLLRIFPLVNEDFCIHIIQGRRITDINNFDINIVKDLCAIITLGKKFEYLSGLVENKFPERENNLKENRPAYKESLNLIDNYGSKKQYDLSIEGWIGAYKTTKNKRKDLTDFPDNFISIFANKKLGEFNILPLVGQNKLNEVYVVGQLHVDLFEETDLPDMALSNRQGYKSDDLRYQTVLQYVRKELLNDILVKRNIYVDLQKKEKKKKNEEDLKKMEAQLKKDIDLFRNNTSKDAAKKISKLLPGTDENQIENVINQSINEYAPNLGLKTIIESTKKKILISQTSADKQLSDIIYLMLLFNNVSPEDILYTNCDDEISRIPEGENVYEYLRNFFVETYSNKKIFVIFVTSENTARSWGALTEIGAAWITQVDNKIFNISPFEPKHPLDDETLWQTTNRSVDNELSMNSVNADIFCQKIEDICVCLGYDKKTRKENRAKLESLVNIT